MGPEDSVKDIEVYANGLRVGSLTEIEEPTTIEPTEPLALGNSLTLRFTASMWTSCRSRKRFVKLMCGVFGVQKRQAEALARAAMSSGCPSYQDLWADCFSYFIAQTIRAFDSAAVEAFEYVTTHNNPNIERNE